MQLFIISLILLTHYQPMIAQMWNYANLGPDIWSNIIPTCAGRFQSPINIQTACTIYQSMTSFQFSSAYNLPLSFNLTNNGVTISTRLTNPSSSVLMLTGGGLDANYTFLEFHLHWGENYGSGSEHEVNNVKYSGEIHFVHINQVTGELAVLGFFIQSENMPSINASVFSMGVSNVTTAEWNTYFNRSNNLRELNSSTMVNLNLASLMGTNLSNFWRYTGSLTNPPCTEGVIWTVFTTPIILPELLLNTFRANFLPQNDRHPQPLNNRIVYRNYLTETVSSLSDDNCCPRSSEGNQVIQSKAFLFIQIFLFFNYALIFINDFFIH